jgi:hypothetical protein
VATVSQLTYGAVNGDDQFTTASVTVATGDLLVVAISIAPATTPVICEPALAGLGVTTWERADDPGTQGQYEHLEVWRGVVASGTTGTLVVDILDDSSDPVTADVCWHVLRITDAPTTSNGADAFFQVVRAGSNSVTLSDFDDASNTALGFFYAGFFPDPDGTLDGDLTEVGTRAASNPGLYIELVAAEGPEESDDAYGITWVGQYIQRALVAEIVTAAPSGVTGASATTQGDNTASGAGTVAIAGSSASTQGSNTVSGAATVLVSGSGASTQGDTTAVAVGAVAVAGSGASTQGGNTVSGSGTVAIVGSSSTTQGDNTVTATGGGLGAISGESATTQGDNTAVATATVSIFASLAATQGDTTLASAGRVAITGQAAITQGDTTVSASDADVVPPVLAVGVLTMLPVASGVLTTSPVALGVLS